MLKRKTMKSNSKKEKTLIVIGSLLILIGVLCNEWILTALFSSDGVIGLSNKMIIWIFDGLCILAGFLLIKHKPCLRVSIREIMFLAIIFILFFSLMEGGLRSFYFIKNKITPRETNLSEYLGWETNANAFSKKKNKWYGEIKYSTTKLGFRVFGDINTDKTKIFIIGDSFTHGHCVSDGSMYYDYLKEYSNNIEIFAYGGGGYGSLQEYMILDNYYDMIKPDIVLWQFCSNDIINNVHELESASFRNNNHMVRPYYVKEGQIEWLYPKQDFGWIYNVIQSSYLLRKLSIRLNILKAEKVGSIEDELSENHPLFIKAAKTTSEIMYLVRKRVGNNPIVAFSVDYPKWLGNTYSDICNKYGICHIHSIPEAVKEAKESGLRVDGSPYDSHWNNVGHSIAGKIIFDYLIQRNLLNTE